MRQILPSRSATFVLVALAALDAAAQTESFPFSGKILSFVGTGLDSTVVRVLAAKGGTISYTTAVTTTRADGTYGAPSTSVDGFFRPAAYGIVASGGTLRIQGTLAEAAFLEARGVDGKTLARTPLRSGVSTQSIKLEKSWGTGPIVFVLWAEGKMVSGPQLAVQLDDRLVGTGSGMAPANTAPSAGRILAAAGDTLHVWRAGYKAKKIVLKGATGNLDDILLDPLSMPQSAPAPLFKDPPYDGATDPTIVWVDGDKAWWIYYTARRVKNCTGQCDGVSWVFGTNYGIASSYDGGATWQYRGVAARPGKSDLNWDSNQNTFWAPDVVYDSPSKTYHMYAAITPGILSGWNEGAAGVVHLSAKDPLNGWAYDAVPYTPIRQGIDPVVRKLDDGKLYLWGKFDDVFTSTDYTHWTRSGSIAHQGEAQYVFKWKGTYWLLEDPDAGGVGLHVSYSADGKSWTRQSSSIMAENTSTRKGDNAHGKHASVAVQGDRAFIIYFTENTNDGTCLQAGELKVQNGALTADRSSRFEFLLRQVSEYR